MLGKLRNLLIAFSLLTFVAGCSTSAEPEVINTPEVEVAAIPEEPAIPEKRTLNDGVFSEAQASAGQYVYDNSCKTCHDMRFYRGVLRSWANQPLIDFWYSILGEMPADNPGSLSDNEYTEVIAYILSENGFPAGDTELDPNNGMEQISIVAP